MVVKFQSKAARQGDLFAQNCLMALQMAGFEIVNTKYRIVEAGIEIDAIANGVSGQGYAFEFKGSWNTNRPGAQRTDTLKKAIANGALFLCSEEAEILPPIILLTSHLPEAGAGLNMLKMSIRRGLLLDIITDKDGDSLRWYSEATAEDIVELIKSRV